MKAIAASAREPERAAANVMRTGVAVSAAGLAAGLVLFIAGRPTAELVLAIGIVTLVTMPVVNVLAILAGEIRRREWPFVAATGVVIAMLVLMLFWDAT